MDSVFKICKKGDCGISIVGLEKDNGEYLEEDVQVINSAKEYKYSETVTVNVIKTINSEGLYEVIDMRVVPHDSFDTCEYTFKVDGLYEISHIILPTDLYVTNYIGNLEDVYSMMYYYDSVSDKFMLYKNKNQKVVDLSDILKVNPYAEDSEHRTTSIVRSDQFAFNLCNLETCLYKISKQVLSESCGMCKSTYSQDVVNRDIVLMSINIITYLTEREQFYEAQRIFESISQCGNICSQMSNNKTSSSCGCGR